MKRISWSFTVFYKKIFPLIWFGILGIFISVNGHSRIVDGKGPTYLVLGFMCLLSVLLFFLKKNWVYGPVDEVYDCGTYLLIKKGKDEEKIALSNILGLNATQRRVTISLRSECRFGKEVLFYPPFYIGINPFHVSPLIKDLINRINKQ